MRRGLPLPSLTDRRTATTVYALATMDNRGRLAAQAIVRALGWTPGTRLSIDVTGPILVLSAAGSAGPRITDKGHLRLPAAIRHRCALTDGDHLLLAAEPDQHQLLVYPPAVLDTALDMIRPRLSGGDPR